MAHAVQVFALLLGLTVVCSTTNLPTCYPPDSPNYGGYHGGYKSYYSLGSVVNYYCNHGYTLHGYSWTVCIHGSRGPYWLYPAPTCKPTKVLRCGTLDNPDNGRVQLTGTSVGSRAEYSCNKGYTLVGDRVRQCLSNGQWSGRAPICRANQCDRLRDIPNGRVSLTGTTVGSTATYTCNSGYILVGGASRTCQANGEWTGREPICQLIECDRLEDIENGRVSLSGTTVGSTATYTCISGYILVGDRTRTCQTNGEWTGREPVCQLIECDRLEDIENGRVSLSGTTVGSTATYTCISGYSLVGDSTRVCQSSGDWSGKEPFCRLLECDRLRDISNGRVSLSGITVGSTATYTCNKGYILVGDTTRVCQPDGEWSGREPFCKSVQCDRLRDIQNGRVSLSGITVGSTATYSCNKGYVLVGDSTRVCQLDGEWSGGEPFCKSVQCDRLRDIQNGRVSLSGTTVGSTATYSCNKGYILVGDATRVCQPDGEWSGREPFCKSVQCDRLRDIQNGRVSLSGITVGSTATYSCNKGYILVGDATRVCQPDGVWSGREPFCKSVQCDRLRDIQDGRVSLSGITVGSTATYSCNKGYVLVGDATRVCQLDGEWSGREPFCKSFQCDRLRNIQNGRVSLSGTTVGSTATYTCNKGYILVGDTTRVCQPDGEWSGREPFCKLIDCGLTLKAPKNGFAHVPCTTLGCTATFWCRSGYTLEGDNSRTCLANGYWSNETPVCRRDYYHKY